MFSRYLVAAVVFLSMLLQGCEHLYDTLSSEEFTRAADDFHAATVPPKPREIPRVISPMKDSEKYGPTNPNCLPAGTKASMCATDGKTKVDRNQAKAAQPSKAPEVSKSASRGIPVSGFGLTIVRPYEATPEELAKQKKLKEEELKRYADEEAALKAKDAEMAARNKAFEDARRAACMKPEARGDCGCYGFFPPTETAGASCRK